MLGNVLCAFLYLHPVRCTRQKRWRHCHCSLHAKLRAVLLLSSVARSNGFACAVIQCGYVPAGLDGHQECNQNAVSLIGEALAA